MTTRERLLDRVVVDRETQCWNWTGSLNLVSSGYGRMSVEGRVFYTHRVAYELFVGPIPDGLQIDHLCRNTRCCNPAHLEAVTPAVNSQRGDTGAHYGRRTHCANGHAFDELNTRIGANGERICRACMRDYKRAYRARLAAAA